ncbi:hypothetical protein Trydic_g5479 [Trypoxylus dichotomus]
MGYLKWTVAQAIWAKCLESWRRSLWETVEVVKLARPRRLNEALTEAFAFEAVKQSADPENDGIKASSKPKRTDRKTHATDTLKILLTVALSMDMSMEDLGIRCLIRELWQFFTLK